MAGEIIFRWKKEATRKTCKVIALRNRTCGHSFLPDSIIPCLNKRAAATPKRSISSDRQLKLFIKMITAITAEATASK